MTHAPHRAPRPSWASSILFAVLLATLVAAGTARAAPGFGGWRFGMSPAEVKAVKACKGYKAVAVTGGLECKGFAFLGQKIPLSFVFAAGKLAKIQVWVYEGKDEARAAKQLKHLFDHLKKSAGPLESPTLKDPGAMTEAQLLGEIRKLKASGADPAKLQFKPRKNPADHFTFGSVIWSAAKGLYVFLYFQPPR
jgi:hypothetical protein